MQPDRRNRISNDDAFRDLLCDLKLWTRRTKVRVGDSFIEATDHGLIAYLLTQLGSQLQGICGADSAPILRSQSLSDGPQLEVG